MGSTLPGRHRFPRTCRQPGQPDRQVKFRIGRCPPHPARRWVSRSRQSALNLWRRLGRAEVALAAPTRVSLVAGCLCLDVVVSSSSVRRAVSSSSVRRVESSSSMQCPRAPMRRPSSWLSFPACDPPSPICETASRRNVLDEFSVGGRLAQSGRPIMTSFWRGERFWARKRVESYGRCLEPAKVAAGRAVDEALGYVNVTMGRRQVSVASLQRARLFGDVRGPRA